MPELPDIVAYVDALAVRVVGRSLAGVRLANPFVLRTAEPPLAALAGREVREVRRVGKRIAFGFEGELWLAIHLMIAGRLHWRPPAAPLRSRNDLAALDFPNGTLALTEAGTKRRAWLRVLDGEAALLALDPGGIDVFACDAAAFRRALSRENRTLKRALTDPRIVDGIGNAYSDEILHEARLSPLALTAKLGDDEWTRLYEAARTTLSRWIERLLAESREGFPERVTAFRDDMAVHGRYGQPCPVCGETVRRIRYADNETNYCARCQTRGVLLADRSLSRVLKGDWPKTLAELEDLTGHGERAKPNGKLG